jgi:excisionase family DNA binding protein
VHFCQASFLELTALKRVRGGVSVWSRRRHAQSMSDVIKIHTADEVADLLGVDYKTVLNLIRRGHLRALPGIRHKLITEAELNRYLGVQPAAAPHAQTAPARPAGSVSITDKSLVNPAAKAVASPVALASQRKIK